MIHNERMMGRIENMGKMAQNILPICSLGAIVLNSFVNIILYQTVRECVQ